MQTDRGVRQYADSGGNHVLRQWSGITNVGATATGLAVCCAAAVHRLLCAATYEYEGLATGFTRLAAVLKLAPPASGEDKENQDTGACGYNRPCAHQYVGKYQSCML